MTTVPFELYSNPRDINVFGHLFIIPNYYTTLELDHIHSNVDVGLPISPSVYPCIQFPATDIISEKTSWFMDNWDIVREMTETSEKTFDEWGYSRMIPKGTHERLQGTPIGMQTYPPHSDLGRKLLTILVPIHPCRGVSTTFHGGGTTESFQLPWEVNTAYMFRPSKWSYHSYSGMTESDRYVMNVNLLLGGTWHSPFGTDGLTRPSWVGDDKPWPPVPMFD